MSIIRRMRKQHAVWWQRSATPNRFGRYGFAAPVEIDCRWEDRVESFVDPQGEEKLSNAMVYVDRILSVGDRLKRGSLESDQPTDPTSDRLAFEVRRFDQLPNLRATQTLLTAYL